MQFSLGISATLISAEKKSCNAYVVCPGLISKHAGKTSMKAAREKLRRNRFTVCGALAFSLGDAQTVPLFSSELNSW